MGGGNLLPCPPPCWLCRQKKVLHAFSDRLSLNLNRQTIFLATTLRLLLVWIADQALSKLVPTYWYCCLLHWSGLPGQSPQQPAGGFWTVHQHSGASFLVGAQSCNCTGLTTQATWPPHPQVL